MTVDVSRLGDAEYVAGIYRARQLQDAAAYGLGIRLDKNRDATVMGYGDWSAVARPDMRWDYPHFVFMQDRLDQVTDGDLRRVLFQVSVRHGKTECNTIGYASYRLERDPRTRILVATYGADQARTLSRAIRKIAGRRGVGIAKDRDAAGHWETEAGGGLKAVGVGTGVASVNADLVIIDDPIGSRADAESITVRDKVWDWISDDILARCEPHTAVLFSMPRWHVDDPAGRIQDRQEGRWEIVDLPGIAETEDPLGRKEGELLWPELRPQSWMDTRLAESGPYGFASLVQGRPTLRSGGQFERAWFKTDYTEIPKGSTMLWVRHWDMAGTEGGGAYTCGLLMGIRVTDGKVFIKHVARGQWGAANRNEQIKATAQNDALKFGTGVPGNGEIKPNKLAVLYRGEQEPGSGGKDQAKAFVRLLAGYRVEVKPSTGDKFTRADPLAGAAKNGDIHVLPGTWREAFLDEMGGAGPGAKYLDQMDAASGAYNRLMEIYDARKGVAMDGMTLDILDDDLTQPGVWSFD